MAVSLTAQQASLGLHEPRSGRFQSSEQASTDAEILCKPLVVSLFTSAPRPKQVLGGLLIQGVKMLTLPFFFFFFFYFIIYLFSAVLGLHCCTGFSLWRAGLLSSHSAQASHCSGCCCRARAPGRAGFNGCGACAQQWLPGSRAQARQLCFMGLVAPWHVRFPLNQGWNSCLLPWQAESYPLSHQEVLTLPSEGRLKASQAGAQVCGRSGRDRGRVHNPPQK